MKWRAFFMGVATVLFALAMVMTAGMLGSFLAEVYYGH